MATIVPPSPRIKPAGSGGWKNEGPPSDRRYYIGMMAALAAAIMLFTAFTSAYIVRKGLSDDWQPIQLPSLLWANTLVLLASSCTLEMARRRQRDWAQFRPWWKLTMLLGSVFLLGQLVVWRQLVSVGVYVATNPSSSFFYVFTGAHAVHLLGGVLALATLTWRMWPVAVVSPTEVGVMALYWHFMDGLWVYLFALLLLGG